MRRIVKERELKVRTINRALDNEYNGLIWTNNGDIGAPIKSVTYPPKNRTLNVKVVEYRPYSDNPRRMIIIHSDYNE